ncbi:DUF3168 domain-containing protein [Brucella sp. 2280]|uniref:DUF3168 domain-containing protein n=1 Tax=Brucella sp. 2280 TaxID=2592625 RepID=UPI001296AF84|nr:DUF3168 domain-containing protein [Brucella sp. 2280]QGA55866.1 DUF3168 domain-containing protein [Brucella sp. 2280]
MASLKNEILRAVYARLTGFAPLNGMKVYDLPKADTPFPYITIGYVDIKQRDITCKRSWQAYIRIDAWSETPGYTEVNEISAGIEEALHNYPLTLPSYRLISISHMGTENLRAPDGILSHAVCEFEAYIEAI